MKLLVVDASIVVDLLARFNPAPIEQLLFVDGTVLLAPELLDIEVLQALRRLELSGAVPSSRTDTPGLLSSMRIRRYAHASLVGAIWTLRHNLSAYDATYVALARQFDSALVTRDKRLAAAQGLGVEVVVP